MQELEYVPPAIGSWYRDISGAIFEVIALDDDDRTVEIQYFDGSLEELDLDVWRETPVEMIEAPKDWSGSFDMDREDYADDIPLDDWSTAMSFIERAD